MEVVNKFCCLGDISPGDGVEESIVARIRYGWKKFRELSPVLIFKVYSLCTKGKIFQAYVRSVIPYGSETWAMAKLERNGMMLVQWICNVASKSFNEFKDRLGLVSIRKWFGHWCERMDKDSWVKGVYRL